MKEGNLWPCLSSPYFCRSCPHHLPQGCLWLFLQSVPGQAWPGWAMAVAVALRAPTTQSAMLGQTVSLAWGTLWAAPVRGNEGLGSLSPRKARLLLTLTCQGLSTLFSPPKFQENCYGLTLQRDTCTPAAQLGVRFCPLPSYCIPQSSLLVLS